MSSHGKPLTKNEFRNLLFENKESSDINFYEFIEQELKVLKVDRAKGTIDNYKKLLNTVKEWEPSLQFHEITLDFIEKFHAYEIEKLYDVYKENL